MIISDFWTVIIFLLYSFAFSFIGFPYVFHLFPTWKDKGAPYAKLFVLITTSFSIWLLASYKLLPFSTLSLYSILCLMILGAAILYFRRLQSINTFLSQNWKLLVFEESIYLLFFFIFLTVRWFNPDLWHPIMGGEKPMDFAFLNAIINTKYFPPQDPWFSGATINYYYFGQVIVATFAKITLIYPAVFYNIMLAFLFGISSVSLFGIVHQLTSSKKIGILGSIFGIALGNLGQVDVILKSLSTHPFYINSWYWTATRIMPHYEINEFPYFTFLYADLHAHLIALPLGLFAIALTISLMSLPKPKFITIFPILLYLSVLLGIIRTTNIWDYPTYFLLIVICLYFSIGIIRTIISTLAIFAISNLAVLPFIQNYKTGPLGLKFYTDAPTAIQDYFIIHGFFLFLVISFLLLYIQSSLPKKVQKFIYIFAAILLTASLLIPTYQFILFISLFLIVHGILLFHSKKHLHNKTLFIPLLFSFFAFFLTLIPDTIDIPLGLGRMNTVFKFYFQAWIFFAIASSSFLPYIWAHLNKTHFLKKWIWAVIFFGLFIAAFSYIPTATVAKAEDRMSTTAKHTLNGMEYMKTSVYYDNNMLLQLDSDYLAVSWMKENISTPGVVLEANCAIYRWCSRVSIYTGFPTTIGWDWHEQAHRSYLSRTVIDNRIADVKMAYETTSVQELLPILRKYHIKYIYIGGLEKAYYNNLGFNKFQKNSESLFEKIYQNSDVTIYKIVPNL